MPVLYGICGLFEALQEKERARAGSPDVENPFLSYKTIYWC